MLHLVYVQGFSWPVWLKTAKSLMIQREPSEKQVACIQITAV